MGVTVSNVNVIYIRLLHKLTDCNWTYWEQR